MKNIILKVKANFCALFKCIKL